MVVAIAENIMENYSNLKILTDLLNLNELKHLDGCVCSNALDMKCANAYFGIGAPGGSKYGCPWCEMMRSLWSNDPMLDGGRLRTLGRIRYYATNYQAAVANHTRKAKLSAADYYGCQNMPLCDDPDSTLVLDLLPPMELHILIGIVNDLYDILEEILEKIKSSVSAKDWSLGMLSLKRPRLHTGQFQGNQCRDLLKNIHKLEQMLMEAGAYNPCKPILAAFQAFNEVKKACFGMELHPNYREHIKNFYNAFLNLMDYCKSLDIKLNVTNKVHAVFAHIHQFLERQKARGLNFGLSYWSEQASECVHKDFESLWTGSSYKRERIHPEYSSHLLNCVVTYNSRHVGKSENTKNTSQ